MEVHNFLSDRVWKARHRGQAAPVLLAALYGEQAALCGPAGELPGGRQGCGRQVRPPGCSRGKRHDL